MLRKRATYVLALFISFTFIIGLSSFTSCDKATPTIPCDCGDDLDPVGSSGGGIGDGDVEMQQDYFSNPETGEMVSETAFSDSAGNPIGNAELSAAQDVVSHISLQNFNVPGETFIDMGGYYTLKIVITSSQSNPTKYLVELTNLETQETVSFFIDKTTGLSKSRAGANNAADGYNDTQLTAGVSTNSVLLCIGAYDAVAESEACLASSDAYCGSRGVANVYIEATFSLANGCESGCKVICKTHDQGAFGS
jgi:hypothetical protein